MSVSGFHHHFKAVTTMSPLQFQKQLRLQEARRLMLGERLDATSADSGSAMTTPRISAASTSGSLASRRCAMSSGCAALPWRAPRSSSGG